MTNIGIEKGRVMRIARYINQFNVSDQVKDSLQLAGFECVDFTREAKMLSSLRRERFDLAIVEADGAMQNLIRFWSACRGDEVAPLILLSEKWGAQDIAAALDGGAEDVIQLPADPIELVARVMAVLRRRKTLEADQLTLAGFTLDRKSNRATDRGVRVHLTPREFAVSWLFFSTPNTFLCRKYISTAIFGMDDLTITGHAMEQHIYLVRKKLRFGPERGIQIRTSYTNGWRLECTHEQLPRISPRDVEALAA